MVIVVTPVEPSLVVHEFYFCRTSSSAVADKPARRAVSRYRAGKNSRCELRFGDLRVTHRVHLWLDGKRIVDFLLRIIKLFSVALTAAALLSEICRNRRFLKGWVTLSANFRYMGTSPAIYLWTVR